MEKFFNNKVDFYKILKIIFVFILTYLVFRYLFKYFMPFILGYILCLILYPLVNVLNKKYKVKKAIASIFAIFIFLLIL